MNDARLDLRLSQELLARVKEAAGDGSVNAYVRDALERALGGPPKRTSAQIAPVLKQRARPARPSVAPDDHEIPLPKIAPRRWGK